MSFSERNEVEVFTPYRVRAGNRRTTLSVTHRLAGRGYREGQAVGLPDNRSKTCVSTNIKRPGHRGVDPTAPGDVSSTATMFRPEDDTRTGSALSVCEVTACAFLRIPFPAGRRHARGLEKQQRVSAGLAV